MLSQSLFCHLLLCAVMLGPVATIVSFSTTSESGLEENCKFLFVPYSTRCTNPNEMIRELLSSKGLAAVCSNTVTHRVVDMENGTVEFSLLLPHNAMNEWIYLFALEPRTGEDQHASCSHNLHGKHSYFQLLEESENQANCSSDQFMEITWKANYLYSGCYMVRADLPSPDPERNCSSKPFYVQTDFEMEPLAYQNLSVTRKTVNDKLTIIVEKELVLNNDCSNPMISTSCIKIKLTSEQQDLPKAIASVFPNCPVVPLLANSLECSCDWKKPQLECTFQDLPVGNYCVQVEALDTRCVRDTVWVNSSLVKKMNNTDPCVWEICNLEIKNNTDRYVAGDLPQPTTSWIIVAFAVAVVSGICLLFYFRSTRKTRKLYRPRPTAEPLDGAPCEKLMEPPEVLLLYARDCRPFMDAMLEFRNLLERTMDVRVFDIWDPARREEMDVNGETRVLYHLSSEDTPVVIMATPVSRAFEDGFLTGNRRYYLVPDSRDEIFLSALHTSIRMTATHSNRCRKFIVARMSYIGCTENILTSFSPLCTIYTLPTHIDRLLLHILNSINRMRPPGARYDQPFAPHKGLSAERKKDRQHDCESQSDFQMQKWAESLFKHQLIRCDRISDVELQTRFNTSMLIEVPSHCIILLAFNGSMVPSEGKLWNLKSMSQRTPLT